MYLCVYVWDKISHVLFSRETFVFKSMFSTTGRNFARKTEFFIVFLCLTNKEKFCFARKLPPGEKQAWGRKDCCLRQTAEIRIVNCKSGFQAIDKLD